MDPDGVEPWLAEVGSGFRWLTAYENYLTLARRHLTGIVGIWRHMNADDDMARAFALKLCCINHDLVRLGCLTVDAARIREAGLAGVYDPAANPVFAYLENGGDANEVAFARNDWPQRQGTKVVWDVKALAKKGLKWMEGVARKPNERFDVISSNELLEQYVAARKLPTRRLFAYLLDRPMPHVAQSKIALLADAVAEAFVRLLENITGGEQELMSRAREGARRICHGHLGRAWEDLHDVRVSGFANRPASILISGTPKYLGRLLSLFHRELGGRSYRFAHGGERVFFDDAEWAINEMPFSDRYICHSWGEAEAIDRRLTQGRVPWIGDGIPKLVGSGTERHEDLRDGVSVTQTSVDVKTVVYVANKYLGEATYLTPNFRCNDILYTEWQFWLLRTLRDLGYRVVVKAHPRERLRRVEMLRKHCDEVDTGPFRPTRFNSRCLLFDFAGTAFFDALAANVGVVLVDMGVRPLDPTTQSDLDRRCNRVPTVFDERNLFRVDPKSLGSAIESATHEGECSSAFFEKYFCEAPVAAVVAN